MVYVDVVYKNINMVAMSAGNLMIMNVMIPKEYY